MENESNGLRVKLTTPDKITLSLRQEIGSAARLLATIEWVNWSTIGEVPITIPTTPLGANLTPALNANWDDGWLYAIGGEYDVSDKLTVRAGMAYEESPITKATSRLIQLPDSDRIWASIGASYDVSETMTVNFAYQHMWAKDADIDREALVGPVGGSMTARAEGNGADIISIGLTSQLSFLSGESTASLK